MIIPYEPEHLLSLKFQPGQVATNQTTENARAMALGGIAMTAIADGRPLACAGILELWPGRGMAWAALDADAGRVMVEITRRMRLELARTPFRRVELYAHPTFPAAIRWAHMLGFEFETCMRCGDPGGGDLLVFRRIKPRAADILRG